MRIDSAKWVHLPNTYEKKTQPETKPELTRQTDQLSISAEARARFEEPVKHPERLEKINALKAEINAGTYSRDVRDIAKRFLQG
ncbi:MULTISPECIES: flagellar biosynthesis anti-sigma factor FlgM [unclassified Exiguobacterium]|uniref:flagellar biosynthesis anti-sigma factor FlgM n=1 Tax=unclassified Exiguobacterium TaxID=2644629 RepID=UPI00103AD772|nr:MULTISPECIES: flagellar biosynthesis anti-sigma factor FlgM [unclassified Exiguobacterium]TCI67224.1 flagellar biosynthesis anti-sigma factor FlgM [Exiguobacterium sp. IPCI3]TCI76682.1 flagellar biosynthesis anti-sigma factor FlgM [Exiguobacterium sp. IPCH1]TCI78333.1 flagellar biosynthesis anti-sigma factor FlgM [Exiguobacterium sp. IPBC4]